MPVYWPAAQPIAPATANLWLDDFNLANDTDFRGHWSSTVGAGGANAKSTAVFVDSVGQLQQTVTNAVGSFAQLSSWDFSFNLPTKFAMVLASVAFPDGPPDVAEDFIFQLGFGPSGADGLYFWCDGTSTGFWNVNAENGGTTTLITSQLPVSGFQSLLLYYFNAGDVIVQINDVVVGSIAAADVPHGQQIPLRIRTENSTLAAASRRAVIDYIGVYYDVSDIVR